MNSLPVEITDRTATVDEYLALRAAVGWMVPPVLKCQAALTSSLFGVVALYGGATIGMARVVGDGEIYATVVDVVVTTQFQGQGIGRAIMNRLIEWSRAREIAHIGLVADGSVSSYYAQWSFQDSGRYLRLPSTDPRH